MNNIGSIVRIKIFCSCEICDSNEDATAFLINNSNLVELKRYEVCSLKGNSVLVLLCVSDDIIENNISVDSKSLDKFLSSKEYITALYKNLNHIDKIL